MGFLVVINGPILKSASLYSLIINKKSPITEYSVLRHKSNSVKYEFLTPYQIFLNTHISSQSSQIHPNIKTQKECLGAEPPFLRLHFNFKFLEKIKT